MPDILERARTYATQAHQRIDHRRKYSQQPYNVHLEAVAKLVASVTDDLETRAAAWLHDTVEDTPATLDDIEREFGAKVAELVEELTDVSRPSDGNRAVRKRLDRQHLAQASSRAKTVKLADLIDNCKDITHHDQRFATVYLSEMTALLEVLGEGSVQLMLQARKVHQKSMGRLGLVIPGIVPEDFEDSDVRMFPGVGDSQFRRMFMEVFSARDLAEPLLSFDSHAPCDEAIKALEAHRQDVASVRFRGKVHAFVRLQDLVEGDCAACIRHFTVDQVVRSDSSPSDVIHVLTRHDHCFVTILGEVAGVIRRDDINKPVARMWLFGIISILEMGFVQLIAQYFPDDSWQENLSEGRIEKARTIQAERMRRNQHCALVDCLQLSDKGQILINDPRALQRLGIESMRTGKAVIRQLESLRNHLAHAQDIVAHDWAQIARLARRVEEVLAG